MVVKGHKREGEGGSQVRAGRQNNNSNNNNNNDREKGSSGACSGVFFQLAYTNSYPPIGKENKQISRERSIFKSGERVRMVCCAENGGWERIGKGGWQNGSQDNHIWELLQESLSDSDIG